MRQDPSREISENLNLVKITHYMVSIATTTYKSTSTVYLYLHETIVTKQVYAQLMVM